MADLPLSTLFKRALDSASKSVDLPTIADETQVTALLYEFNDRGLSTV